MVKLFVSFTCWFNFARTATQLGSGTSLGTAGYTQSKTGYQSKFFKNLSIHAHISFGTSQFKLCTWKVMLLISQIYFDRTMYCFLSN